MWLEIKNKIQGPRPGRCGDGFVQNYHDSDEEKRALTASSSPLQAALTSSNCCRRISTESFEQLQLVQLLAGQKQRNTPYKFNLHQIV